MELGDLSYLYLEPLPVELIPNARSEELAALRCRRGEARKRICCELFALVLACVLTAWYWRLILASAPHPDGSSIFPVIAVGICLSISLLAIMLMACVIRDWLRFRHLRISAELVAGALAEKDLLRKALELSPRLQRWNKAIRLVELVEDRVGLPNLDTIVVLLRQRKRLLDEREGIESLAALHDGGS